MNVAVGEFNVGSAYSNRTERARVTNDWVQCMANLELALPHYREADQIHRANNLIYSADEALRQIAIVEQHMWYIRITNATTVATTRK